MGNSIFKAPSDESDWYKETGSGMGNTLNIAAAMDAITLTDRATWISFRNKSNLAVIFENHPLSSINTGWFW